MLLVCVLGENDDYWIMTYVHGGVNPFPAADASKSDAAIAP